jgi:hypothetical protein
MKSKPLTIRLGLVAAVLAGGCSPAASQLERVAKDWCLTIRASQVIPVYPLTEDLEPGDVFLVTVPIHDEARTYEQNGFLPIDMHVTRLAGLDYREVYDEGAFGPNPGDSIPISLRRRRK